MFSREEICRLWPVKLYSIEMQGADMSDDDDDFYEDGAAETIDENGVEGDQGDNFDDAPIKRQDASELNQTELDIELKLKGIKPQGFKENDARTLQEIYDREYEEFVAKAESEREQMEEKKGKRKAMLRRKLIQEQRDKQETDEIQNNPTIQGWLGSMKQNSTHESARIEVNSVTARVIAKAMRNNASLLCLDLSRNNLDNLAGWCIGRMLRKNSTLIKLELDSNNLGSRACGAIGEALKRNSTLAALNLESNPLLTDRGSDVSGMKILTDALTVNNTLTSLNLWRSNLGEDTGRLFAEKMKENSALVFLDVGNNQFATSDLNEISSIVESNKELGKRGQAEAKEIREQEDGKRAEERKMDDNVMECKEVAAWMEDQKVEREDSRRKDLAEERKRRDREQAIIQEKINKEREQAALKAEAEAKKKKGKKKKK